MAFSKHGHFSRRKQGLSGKCKALAHPGRLELLDLLVSGDKHVNDLVRKMPLSQGSVSGHLEILLRHEIVGVEVEGLYNRYTFDLEKLEGVYAELGRFIGYLRNLRDESEVEAGNAGGNLGPKIT